MSWEGHCDQLCEKGHLHSHLEDFCIVDHQRPCPDCGSRFVFENVVDDTNGCERFNSPDGAVPLKPGERCEYCGDMRFELDKPAVYHACAECGTQHLASPETYKIPGR